MPNSIRYFDHVFADQIQKMRPTKMLDIGAGYGKYGRMTKKYVPSCHRTAIEPVKKYIEDYRLDQVYDEIVNTDLFSAIKDGYFDNKDYNVVTLGDVLEHMFLSQALDVINYLSYKTEWIVIQYPTQLNQPAIGGVEWERHLSNFSINDFARYNIQYYTQIKDPEDTPSGIARHHYLVIATTRNLVLHQLIRTDLVEDYE